MNTKKSIEAIHKRLIKHLDSTKNLTILDYGCGKGNLTKALLELKNNPALIYAVDNEPTIIEEINNAYAREITHGNVKAIVISDPKQLTGTSFDTIFCHNVLELITDKEQFVADLYNLLKENGAIILSHMDFDSMIYNSSFKELTRKLIHHFADTQQAWMHDIDGQIGRKIPGIIKRTGIQDFTFETWRWTETTFYEEDYGYLMALLLIETGADSFDAKELVDWKKDLEEKAKNRDYFFAIDIDVAKIKR